MDVNEFNLLLFRLIQGLPATLVITRLSRALYAVVDACGDDGAAALRSVVELREGADALRAADMARAQARAKKGP